MENMEHDYFITRRGFSDLYQELTRRSCKIAFLGNSVTAQKEGYKKYLIEQIDTGSHQKHQYINAGIGGVGSLATAFLTDDFVLRHEPDFCFVDCTVADINSATPLQYIGPSVEGIVKKLLEKNIRVCFLHLYNSHTDEERKNTIISQYENILDQYQLPSINISKVMGLLVDSGKYLSSDILYNGIHTTESGSQITTEYIYSAFQAIGNDDLRSNLFSTSLKNIAPFSFHHTQIILPSSSLVSSSTCVKQKRFRSIIKYLELNTGDCLRFIPEGGNILGMLIVADEQSGVVMIESNSVAILVQTFDEWCEKERIQAIIFNEPILSGNEIKISLSESEDAPRGANGTINPIKKIGQSLKTIGFMVALYNEPQIQIRLW